MLARPLASETVAERAVCRLKCSVVANVTAGARPRQLRVERRRRGRPGVPSRRGDLVAELQSDPCAHVSGALRCPCDEPDLVISPLRVVTRSITIAGLRPSARGRDDHVTR